MHSHRLPTARRVAAILSVGAGFLVAACSSSTSSLMGPPGKSVFAVSSTGSISVFGIARPDSIQRTLTVTGLQSGETLVGLDFGPRNNVLYGVGSSSRIYTVDTTSGVATAIGAAAFTPALSGTAFGIDFNPTPNRIRVHSNTGQNLRLNQLTGAVAAVDTALTYATGDVNAGATPALVGTAYTVTIGDTTTTKLYAIDSEKDVLVTLAAPNSGKASTIGALGVNTTSDVGFDIQAAAAGTTGTAFATLTTGSKSALYTINLTTGAATKVGDIGANGPFRGIAVAP